MDTVSARAFPKRVAVRGKLKKQEEMPMRVGGLEKRSLPVVISRWSVRFGFESRGIASTTNFNGLRDQVHQRAR